MVHEVLHLKKVLHNFMIQHYTCNTTVNNIDTCIIRALVKKQNIERKKAIKKVYDQVADQFGIK